MDLPASAAAFYGALLVPKRHLEETSDASGATLECYDYLPFGRMLSSGDNSRNTGCYPPTPGTQISSNLPQKFTGKERDAQTKLDFFGARYYSAAQGRFTSPDTPFADQHPENPQSWNLYGYVRNNPLIHIDIDGHETKSWLDRITDYLGSLFRSTVDLKSFQDPKPPSKPEPELMGLNGDRIVQKHAETLGKGLDALATGVELADPTGLASATRKALEGDSAGFALAMGAALIPGASKEKIIPNESFEQARNAALKVMGELGPAARTEVFGKQGVVGGLEVGFRTRVGNVFKEFRLDFDKKKGAHINVTVGKKKYAFTFDVTEEELLRLLGGNVGK